MTIGLITEPESYTRKHFFKRLFKIRICEKIMNTLNSFEVDAEILPYSPKGFEKMSSSRLEKLIKQKVNLLKKNGVTKLILSDNLYELCKAKCIDTSIFANGNGNEVFFKLMPLCLRQITKQSGIDLFSANVCIRDTKMDRISEYLAKELCFDTNKICLCTQNLRSATTFCESFCDETGLWIDVCNKLDFRYDILIDVDNCLIKIGNDLFVRDAKFDFNFCHFRVCHTDVASLLPSYNLSSVSWVYSDEK